MLSRDFRKDQGEYEDYDNLYAMYLLFNLGRYAVRVCPDTKLLQLEQHGGPLPYGQAADLAARAAKADSENFGRRTPFRRQGTTVDLAGAAPAD